MEKTGENFSKIEDRIKKIRSVFCDNSNADFAKMICQYFADIFCLEGQPQAEHLADGLHGGHRGPLLSSLDAAVGLALHADGHLGRLLKNLKEMLKDCKKAYLVSFFLKILTPMTATMAASSTQNPPCCVFCHQVSGFFTSTVLVTVTGFST